MSAIEIKGRAAGGLGLGNQPLGSGGVSGNLHGAGAEPSIRGMDEGLRGLRGGGRGAGAEEMPRNPAERWKDARNAYRQFADRSANNVREPLSESKPSVGTAAKAVSEAVFIGGLAALGAIAIQAAGAGLHLVNHFAKDLGSKTLWRFSEFVSDEDAHKILFQARWSSGDYDLLQKAYKSSDRELIGSVFNQILWNFGEYKRLSALIKKEADAYAHTNKTFRLLGLMNAKRVAEIFVLWRLKYAQQFSTPVPAETGVPVTNPRRPDEVSYKLPGASRGRMTAPSAESSGKIDLPGAPYSGDMREPVKHGEITDPKLPDADAVVYAPGVVNGTIFRASAAGGDEENFPPLDKTDGDHEDSDLGPVDFLSVVEKDFVRAKARYGGVKGKLSADVRSDYEAEIERIDRRLNHWLNEATKADSASGDADGRYREDVKIGIRLLLDRVTIFAADVYSEPVDETLLGGVGLRDRHKKVLPKDKKDEDKDENDDEKDLGADIKAEQIVPGLVNHDVGYGPHLKLRRHQVAVINRFRGILKMREEAKSSGEPMRRELLEGTVDMATGGGKTRLMIAAFAEFVRGGSFRVGDKFIIVDHTTSIHAQNREVAELLGPYFREKMGRDLKISEYKAEKRDLSGDVIIVSLPSVNTEGARLDFISKL